jgi:phosphinothricin acetyltransferase
MIRLATPDDGPALAAIYDPVVEGTAISFEIQPPGGVEMGRRVASVLQHAPWLVDDEGGVRGYAYASKHRERAAYAWAVDAAVYVAASSRREGIGRRLYGKLFELLRLQGFTVVCAGVTLPNEGSVALHESVGFTTVGVYRGVGYKLGAWHDVRWLQRDLAPRTPTPALPPSGADARALWSRALEAP